MGEFNVGKAKVKFTDSHEWITLTEKGARVGITDKAQQELGEIVYIQLPPLGKEVQAGQEIAIVESTKAATDVYAPASGVVVAINEQVQNAPSTINCSAEDEGWLFEIQLTNPQELDDLFTRKQYLNMCYNTHCGK